MDKCREQIAVVGAVACLNKHDYGGIKVIGLLLQPHVSYLLLMKTVAGAVFLKSVCSLIVTSVLHCVRTEADLASETLTFPLSPSSSLTSFHILPVAPLLRLYE